MKTSAVNTPKGTPPLATRRAAKAKRREYGLFLMERAQQRRLRKVR